MSYIYENIFLPGDIFITRNAGSDEIDNRSPGFFNHLAIYVGCDKIVEGQDSPHNSIIESNISEFLIRYPIIRVFRHPYEKVREKAAEQARKKVGVPYRRVASIFRFLRRTSKGENCVSLVRKCYKEASGYYAKWFKPDDAYYHFKKGGRFKEVFSKGEIEV